MSCAVTVGFSVYMASGPPGARCISAKPMTNTPTSRTADWAKRLTRKRPTPDSSGRRPVCRVPRVRGQIGIHLVALHTILYADDRLVREDRCEGQVVKQDHLNLVVDRLTLLEACGRHALVGEFVDLRILVLDVIRAAASLGRNRCRADAVAIVGVRIEQRVPAHHQRVELALDRVVAR